MSHRRLALAAAIAIAGLSASACEPIPGGGRGAETPPGTMKPVYIAKHWDGILLELGMPDALPFLGDGWSYGEEAPDGNAFRWAVAEEAAFSFVSDRQGERLGYLEVEPFRFESAPVQFVGLTVNGIELEPIELREGRARYPVDVPLVLGRNDVSLRFRYAGDPSRSRADRRKLAVAFYRFDVPPDDEAPVAGRPGPFAWVDDGLYLPPGSGVTFFRPAGEGIELVIGSESASSPQLRAPRGAELLVTARAGETTAEHRVVVDDAVTRFTGELPLAGGGGSVEINLATTEHGLLVRPVLPRESDGHALREASAAAGTSDYDFDDETSNVLVVVLDGANALRMGLHGYERDTTPVIDRLGRESVVFDVAVSQAVYTIASIGSLLTGQYPDRHQTVTFADRLRDDVVTLPGLLTEAGFRTAAFAGNAVVSDAFGLDRGYETFVSVPRLRSYTGHGDSVVAAFREWIATVEESERFFAYVHFREPHFPYNPPAPFDARFGAAPSFPGGMADADELEALNRDVPSAAVREQIESLYDGNLAYVDGLVEEVLACVDDSTIVIVTADHGEALFEHDFLGHNTQLYEESIRIPLMIKMPGVAPKRVADVVELLDLTPTLLEVAGLGAHPAAAAMQGESLLPVVLGQAARSSGAAFTRTVWDEPRYSVRTATHKLIWDSRTGDTELYDLETDPKERDNLAGRVDRAHSEAYLRHRLFTWYRRQEKLKAGEPPPASSEMSPADERNFKSLGYANELRR